MTYLAVHLIMMLDLPTPPDHILYIIDYYLTCTLTRLYSTIEYTSRPAMFPHAKAVTLSPSAPL